MRNVGRAVLLGLVLAASLPGLALAHADLVSSTPAAGSVGAPVSEVVLTFSEAVVGNSSFSVVDSSGTVIATGGPSATEPTLMRATLPALGGGRFEVRWTSVADDGDIQHGTFTFDFAVGTPPGSPTATAATASAATSPASAAPSPTPSSQDAGTSTGTDVLIPIVAAVVLIVAGLTWFLRRRGAA